MVRPEKDSGTGEPGRTELTIEEVGELLNVSRPFVVKLLEDGIIPYRRVGDRRKVDLADLLDYKRRDDARRMQVLDELTQEAERIGLEY